MKRSGYQQRLARLSGLSESYISLILSGKRRVKKYDVAEKLAAATKTEPILWINGLPGDLRKAARDV